MFTLHARRVGTVAILLAAATACGSSKSSGTGAYGSPTTTAPATTTTGSTGVTATTVGSVPSGSSVTLATVGADKIVVNDKGLTLYSFKPDTATTSACGAGCIDIWPPAVVTGTPDAGTTGLTLGALTRSDGTKQLTVDGHPVYTYTGDKTAGDVSGQGLGNNWYYLGADGKPIDKS